MYKIMLTHRSGQKTYKAGETYENASDITNIGVKLERGLVAEIKTVSPEVKDDQRKPAKRTRKAK